MSYESAPATKLLATHCACCSRPLVDAVSVETGIGPDCRKKHGYTQAQAEPNWEAVMQLTDGLVSVAELFGTATARTPHPRLTRRGGSAASRLAALRTSSCIA
jgi:hypothetical protein